MQDLTDTTYSAISSPSTTITTAPTPTATQAHASNPSPPDQEVPQDSTPATGPPQLMLLVQSSPTLSTVLPETPMAPTSCYPQDPSWFKHKNYGSPEKPELDASTLTSTTVGSPPVKAGSKPSGSSATTIWDTGTYSTP